MAEGEFGQPVTINAVEMGPGWMYFEVGEVTAGGEQLPITLNRAMYDWLHENPGYKVRATQGIVVGGMTVGIHIWYDG